VRDVRKALGDEAQQLLRTVPKRGYLLAAEVTPTDSTTPAPRAERRLAAILAADIVGYSRLIEEDEAGTLAAIKELRASPIDPLLAEHKGRIVKLMGDGAIVEFGSVVDAVACAVAIQKAVADRQAKSPPDRRIAFRIGVNLGDVVVDGDDLLGDGVNVAARLEQLCEPGGVLVSGTAFDHLQGRLGLPLEFTGEQQVKNIARPVRAYRVRLDGMPPSWVCATRDGSVATPWPQASLCSSSSRLRPGAGGGGRPARLLGRPCPTSHRSWFCRSTTSPAMSALADLPTAWWRTSLATCRDTACSPSRVARASATATSRRSCATRAPSVESWACVTLSTAASTETVAGCAPPSTSSMPRPERSSGPNSTIDHWTICSRCRMSSDSASTTP
jgi:class 3 adenylate cyclase